MFTQKLIQCLHGIIYNSQMVKTIQMPIRNKDKWYILTMKYYLTIKKNEVLTQHEPENIELSERRQL